MRLLGMALVGVLVTAPAWGHPLDMSMLNVQVEGERVLQLLTLRQESMEELLGPSWAELPPDQLMAAVFSATLGASQLSSGSTPCELTPFQLEPGDDEGTLRLTAAGSCPTDGPLTQHLGVLSAGVRDTAILGG